MVSGSHLNSNIFSLPVFVFISKIKLIDLLFRAVGDKGQSEFEESLRKLFQALVQLMADVKNETLLTQVTSFFTLS